MESLDTCKLRFSQLAALTGMKRHTVNARARSLFSRNALERNNSNQILLTSAQVRQIIADRFDFSKGKIIYIGNLKGGVGKTAFTYLIGNAIAALGIKCCIIDLDTQANLTHQYVKIDSNQPIFYDIIENKSSVKDTIIKLSENLDFIPSALKNSLIQKSLAVQTTPKHYLSWFNQLCLNQLRQEYEIILVDTPPHLTTLNSVFCLCLLQDDHVVIPANADEFSIEGIQMFLEDMIEIRKSYQVNNNPKLTIVINKFLQTQKTNLEMLVKMGQLYGDILSEVVVKDNAKIRETINNKVFITNIKHSKEIYEIISNLLHEFNILKSQGE